MTVILMAFVAIVAALLMVAALVDYFLPGRDPLE